MPCPPFEVWPDVAGARGTEVVFALAITALPPAFDDWPQMLGPTRNGSIRRDTCPMTADLRRTCALSALAAVMMSALNMTALAQSPQPTAYEAFVKLAREQRREFWGKATPDEKSEIAQGHARTWLKQNEKRLSTHQIAFVTDATGLLTADIYAAPESDAVKAKIKQLQQRLSCVIWKSDFAAAFRPVSDPVAVSWLENMSEWLNGCFLGR